MALGIWPRLRLVCAFFRVMHQAQATRALQRIIKRMPEHGRPQTCMNSSAGAGVNFAMGRVPVPQRAGAAELGNWTARASTAARRWEEWGTGRSRPRLAFHLIFVRRICNCQSRRAGHCACFTIDPRSDRLEDKIESTSARATNRASSALLLS